MNEATSYKHISEKKSRPELERLSDENALARALDLMDFYAALKAANEDLKDDSSDILWIELKEAK
ncbi:MULTISPECIES: hypothetical protein [unclassified Imperialibacter]|uniref:hypothetical protein n=1 Tax=unclassified Imperialibacter TaxID=2629706 RepID=UPI00125B156A|nr:MULTISPECIES: hypothetical protein [unclassified Imperialibacter]CAD5253618.1 conserved hypothetical protein [Imperialibacter sp. 89]CAD5275559.1 conserved hypothetical protein [Imperialibacter sp. 75]VVT19834.1 conserved hypothetical protein [Imperialibacter sp. EC-SDR9]